MRNSSRSNKPEKKATLILAAAVLLSAALAGCSNDVLDPTQIGRYSSVPVVNVILESLGVADEPTETYAGAEDPRPEDLLETEQDYMFGVGDVVRISIYELFADGTSYINDYRINESGLLSLPEVGQVRAVGLTEVQLEQELKRILSPTLLKDPSVTVILMQSESRAFSIIGQAIAGPGRYGVPRYTFRLTEAIALAGGIAEFNSSYIYVSREVPVENYNVSATTKTPEFKTPEADQIELKQVEPSQKSEEEEMFELIQPYAKHSTGRQIVITSAEMITESELEMLAAPEGFEMPASVNLAPEQMQTLESSTASSGGNERIEWVFEDGRWIPVRTGAAPPQPQQNNQQAGIREVAGQTDAAQYGWKDIGSAGKRTRVIKIPVDKLLGGDPLYDIVIKPGDRIAVPLDIIGEFCINGNVNGSGYIPLTGRKMTLKQAISAAGGLNALAWPKKIEVVRRLGRNKAGLMQEETVLVDLDKIAKGLQPDFFIKPDDWINVGTHGTSRWLAILRNAFRATYGFGFIYDRNFASRDYNSDPFPGHISINDIF